MSEIITITGLNEGISIKNDPSAIPEGALYDCIGWDVTEDGILKTSGGLASHDFGTLLPNVTDIQCIQICYINSIKYVLATSRANGLYANGVLIDSSFTGRFKALSYLNNIYLVNGAYAKRFDGTTCYKWGIEAPTTIPTIAPGTYLYKDIDTFEDLTDWIAHQVDCVVSRATIGTDLVTNGSFTGSGAGWTFDPVDWTYNANAMDKDADGVGTLSQTLAHTIGKKYLLTFTISNWTVGTVAPTFGGVAGTAVGANGTYYQVITPTTVGDLIFTPTNPSRFTIDSVPVYELLTKVGDSAIKFTVPASTKGSSYKALTIDGTKFSTGEGSVVQDYLTFWLYIDELKNIEELTLLVDVGDGSFKSDYYSYTIVLPGLEQSVQALGIGKTGDLATVETMQFPPEAENRWPYGSGPWNPFEPFPEVSPTGTPKKVVTASALSTIDPVLYDQVFTFWRRNTLFQLKSATWTEIKIPKSLFIQNGDVDKTWNTIVGIKIEATSTSLGVVNIYFDAMRLIGGSDLIGDYWFLYGWGRKNADGVVLHYSSPVRDRTTKQLTITGPITFDRQPLVYGTRVASSDPQVGCCVLYGIGSSLSEFWELSVIPDNLTTGGTLYSIGDKFATRRFLSLHSEPAPPGTDLVLYKNKIWMVGDSAYPGIFRSSDILSDGSIAPEAWPTRNAYEPSENSGQLLSISVLNKQLSVKGEFGDWIVQISDPTDFLGVIAQRVSELGILGKDAMIPFETSQVYPSTRGFVETNGISSKFILPDVEPLITPIGMSDAVGVNAGLVSYFTFRLPAGERTAKIDLYKGTPRIAHINNLKHDWLLSDAIRDVVYAVHNGLVYILDSGSLDESHDYSAHGEMLSYLKSRVYRQGSDVAWTRVSFPHNTNDQWFILEVYIDNILRASRPFKSTSRTVGEFRFGPVSGRDFQFVIQGYRILPCEIHFPIRIYHSGTK